jgi:hypothetical protein
MAGKAKRMPSKSLHLVTPAPRPERKPRGWRACAMRHLRSQGLPFIVALALSVPAFFIFDRRPPAEFSSGKVRPDKVEAGENASIQWDVQWRRDGCDAHATSVLVTDKGIVSELDGRWMTNLHDGDLSRDFHVSWTFLPGTVQYRATFDFECNWLQRIFPIRVEAPPVAFEVTASQTLKALPQLLKQQP